MKKLAFLFNIRQFESYNVLNQIDSTEIPPTIIALDFNLRLYLKQKEINYEVQEEYITFTHAVEFENAAFDIADNWHKDQFEFKGISLGLLVKYNLKYKISKIMRYIEIVYTVIEKEKPSEVIIVEDFDKHAQEFNNILKKICNLENLQCKIIPMRSRSNENAKPKHPLEKSLILQYIKEFYILIFFKVFIGVLTAIIWFLKTTKLLKKNARKKNILMIGHGSYYPLNDELSKDNNVILQFSRRDFSQIKKNFVNYFSGRKTGFYKFFEDYRDKNIRITRQRFLNEIKAKWMSIFNSPDFQAIFSYKKKNLWQFFEELIYETIFTEFRNKIESILIVNKILKKERIDLIIFYADTTDFSLPFAVIASKYNIHSIVIQHGILCNPDGFIPLRSELFAAWGKKSKDVLLKYGMPENKIVLTGAPRFDRYLYVNRSEKLKASIKKSVYKDFRIREDKKLLVLTTGHSDFRNQFLISAAETQLDVEEYYSCILNSIMKHPDMHLIIKLHPGDLHINYSEAILEYFNLKNVSLIVNYNIENLIIASDCLITTTSGTGLEAMLVEKPVIIILLRDIKLMQSYTHNSVYQVNKCEDFEGVLKLALNEPDHLITNQKKFLNENLVKVDMYSTKRVSKIIKDLLSS